MLFLNEIPYGFCGIPCALCPYYYLKGISRFKGYSHDDFFIDVYKIYKCCKSKDLSHCAVCGKYPCKKCIALKSFNCLNIDRTWLRIVASIQSSSFDD